MARGRKPKPVELKDAEGNLGRRPLPEPLLRNQPLSAEPPVFLAEPGKELWRELVGRLGSVGALDSVDRVSLTAMCAQWDLAEDARRVLNEQGQYARGSRGQLVAHPAIGVMRSAHLALLRFCAEYAATPVARARVATARAQANAAAELEQIIDAEAIEEAEEIDGDAL